MQAAEKIDLYSSGLTAFDDENLINQLIDVLGTKPGLSVNVVCGDIIMGCKRKGQIINLLLEVLKVKNNAKVYYNPCDVIEQIADGYTHAIVVDGGKLIFLEAPHLYKSPDSANNKTDGLVFSESYDLGLELFERHGSYMRFNNFVCNDYDLVYKNIYSEAEFCKRTSRSVFKNLDGYERLRAKQVCERLKGGNVGFELDCYICGIGILQKGVNTV